jgi:hypothetical protein
MNSSRFIIPIAWLFSIAAAFVIGEKTTPSSENHSKTSSSRSSLLQSESQHSSAGRASASRRKTPSSKSRSHSSQTHDIRSIIQNEDPTTRASDIIALINTLGPNDFQQVVADFRAQGITKERMGEYSMLLHAWAKVDPLGALDYAEQNTGTPFARQTILTSWASDDPDSALLWAKDHHEGDGANPWLIGVIQGIATKDTTRATEILHELPYSRERGKALSTIIPHIAQQGQEKAILWLSTITDERLATGATAYLASSLAKQNAPNTAEWVSSLEESEGKSRAAREVARQWANQDLSSALAWTDTLDGASQINAAREVIGLYAKENPTEASSWLETMSNTPGYENVVRSYIWNTAQTNPELSLSHIPEITSQKSQRKYYERILRSWKNRDANAAENWMDQHAVSDKLRNRINR